jgi:hypothetical protein
MASIIGSNVGILICGGASAWALVTAAGLTGTSGAIVAAIVGMVVSMTLRVAGSPLPHAPGWIG